MESDLLKYIERNQIIMTDQTDAVRFIQIKKIIKDLYRYRNNSQLFSRNIDLLSSPRIARNLTPEFNREIKEYEQKTRMLVESNRIDMEYLDKDFDYLFSGNTSLLADSFSKAGISSVRKGPSKRKTLKK